MRPRRRENTFFSTKITKDTKALVPMGKSASIAQPFS